MENNNTKNNQEKNNLDNIADSESNHNISSQELSQEDINKVNAIDDSFLKKIVGKAKKSLAKPFKSISKVIPFTREFKAINKERHDKETEEAAENIIVDKEIDKSNLENEIKDFDNQLRNIEQKLKYDIINKSEKEVLENTFNNIESQKKKALNQLDFVKAQNAKYNHQQNTVNNPNLSQTSPSSTPTIPNKYSADYFEGAQFFEEGFEAKDKRNIFSKWFEDYKLKKFRKGTNKLYQDREKNLNENFFQDLLSKRKMEILRDTDKNNKQEMGRKLIQQTVDSINKARNEIENYKGYLSKDERYNILKRNGISSEVYENYKRKSDQDEIFRKLKLKEEAENSIQNRINQNKDNLDLKRKRRRFANYVEKEIDYTKAKIEKLKLRKACGDKDEIKVLEKRLKALNKIEREKDNRVVKFTKELLKRRKERLNTAESKTEQQKIKKEFFYNLKVNGGGALWEAIQTLAIGPLKAT